MSDSDPDLETEEQTHPVKSRPVIEEIIMVVLIMLSLGGIAVMSYHRAEGYPYWIVMVFIFALSAILISFTQAKHNNEDYGDIVKEQLFHWGGTFLALGGVLVLSLDDLDGFNEKTEGYAILLILSLATYLDGLRFSWRFALVGNFLGLTAVVMAYTVYFMWVLYAVALLIIGLVIFWDKQQIKKPLMDAPDD